MVAGQSRSLLWAQYEARSATSVSVIAVGSASRDLGEATGSRNEVKSAAAEGKVEEVVGTREPGQSQMVFLW
jgi:hypothetical protein